MMWLAGDRELDLKLSNGRLKELDDASWNVNILVDITEASTGCVCGLALRTNRQAPVTLFASVRRLGQHRNDSCEHRQAPCRAYLDLPFPAP